MRIARPWYFIRCFYPEAVFRLRTEEKEICLTFDDGPDPLSTPEILSLAAEYGITAVFFCTGEKVRSFPGIFNRIVAGGHVTGNHGFSHPDGWKTDSRDYINDVQRASELIPGKIFRPPYGRLTPAQYAKLKREFKIFFWDIMPYDFDKDLPWESSFEMLRKKLRPGSVIALHDKAESSCHHYLRQFIEYALGNGYRFVLPR